MNARTILAYAWDSSIHCPCCTEEAAAVGLLTRKPPLSMRTDENGLTDDLIDREGDAVGPVFAEDHRVFTERCDDCGAKFSD